MRELLFVMLTVSAPFLIGIFVIHYFRYRSEAARIAAAAKDSAEVADAALRQQVRRLQERVEVLEAIVTDTKYDLNRKISGL
ncbi:MAG: nitrite reductase [Gammaproteobacteria bacterium]|nr:nitrite reductase [Gammaproteobacteria bacterium]